MKDKIGEILIKKKKISQAQLQHALNIQKATGEKIGQVLLSLHYITEDDLVCALSEQYNIPLWEGNVVPDLDLTNKIGLENCLQSGILPVLNGKTSYILICAPNDEMVGNVLLSYNLFSYPQALAPKGIIIENLKRIIPKSERQKRIDENVKKIMEKGVSSGVLPNFVDFLLEEAILQGASDIHIEPAMESTDIRYRIDGILVPVVSLPRLYHDNLVNVLYSRAEITQSEFAKYHDATFSFKFAERNVDIRLSSVPSYYGASIVLRILDRSKVVIPLRYLGYREEELKVIEKMIKKPEGLIIFTGPTGSGKTTSLYSILNTIRSEEIKIITIEDPPEVELPGVIQCAINPKAGITYANAIRGFLRHDPDVILVGEIRDSETAEECVRATLTGHRTFSTLHTFSAVSSIIRLNDLGVHFSYISMVLAGVVNQRLVRKLCPFCKREIDVPYLYKKLVPEGKVYTSSGCEYCYNGYKGRIPVVETLYIDEQSKKLIEQGKIKEFEKMLLERNHKSLFQDAIELVRTGITSIEEIERVVGEENED